MATETAVMRLADAPWTWRGDHDPTQAAREVMAHPRFAEACRALALNTLDRGDEDRALGALFRDAGHYVAAMSALYLDAAGGMTLSHLKGICAATGFASPGRSRSMLIFLQHIGFVAPIAGSGRSTRYLPTTRFLTAWSRHLQGALAAAALIDPATAHLADQLVDPGVFAVFLRVEASRLQRLSSTTSDVPPFERLFMQRYAGLQIVSEMVASGSRIAVLSDEVIHISAKQSAARFDVSPIHVRRLLADAAAEGLLQPLGRAKFAVGCEMRETVAFFYALQLTELAISAFQTMEMLK